MKTVPFLSFSLLLSIVVPGGSSDAAEALSVADQRGAVRRVGVLIAPGFEMLDALGPYETFKEVEEGYYEFVDIHKRAWLDDVGANSCAGGSVRVAVEFAASSADAPSTNRIIEWVKRLMGGRAAIPSSSGVGVLPEFDLSGDADAARFDLLVIGAGVDGPHLRDYVRAHHDRGGLIMTVCAGAGLVAEIGDWLHGKEATSNSLFLDGFRESYPEVRWISLADDLDRRFVRSTPQITTTAGITAGIDGTLDYIAKWCGADVSEATRQCLEWPLRPSDTDPAVETEVM